MSTDVIDEMIADVEEFLDSVDGLDHLLGRLHDLAGAETPTPDAELRALLAGPVGVGAPARPVGIASRRSAIAGLAAATVATLTLTGTAAAANDLPEPLQRGLAHFSEHYLPFTFPRPVGDPPPLGWHEPTSTGSDGFGSGLFAVTGLPVTAANRAERLLAAATAGEGPAGSTHRHGPAVRPRPSAADDGVAPAAGTGHGSTTGPSTPSAPAADSDGDGDGDSDGDSGGDGANGPGNGGGNAGSGSTGDHAGHTTGKPANPPGPREDPPGQAHGDGHGRPADPGGSGTGSDASGGHAHGGGAPGHR